MNKNQLREIIKEELKAVLKEFKSTTVFDLEVVMEVMGIRFKEQGDGGLVAVVRKVAEEAAEDARDESGAEAEELMRIAKLSRKCASLMSEAIVLLASATQEREALEESGAKMVEGTLQMTDSGQRIYDEVAPALKDVVKAIFASHGVDDISIEAVTDALKDVAKMVEKY